MGGGFHGGMGGGGMGGGGMRGGMGGGMRGGDGGPSLDSLSDDSMQGVIYDQKVIMRLAKYIGPHKKDALISLVAVMGYTAGNVLVPLFFMLGINSFVNDGNLTGLHMMFAAFVAVIILHFVANYYQFVYMPKVGQGILFALRTEMFSHLQSLSPAFFHRTSTGRIMSRSQSDVLQLQEFFELMVQSLADVLSLGGIVLAMLIIDWRLAMVTMGVIPILFFLLAYWQRFAKRSFMRIRRAIAMVNGEYNQNITGVRVVESLNRQDENLRHFDELNYEHLDANLQATRFSGGLQPMVEILTGTAMGALIVLGGMFVIDGALEWGVLIAFAMWIQRFFEPIRHLTMQYAQVQRAMAAGQRIFELMDLEAEVQDAPDAIDMPTIEGDVRYEGVSFQYIPGTDVLKDIDLHFTPGETVAIVGPTGAGKSTFVTLLSRFADVTEGAIKIDGHDIREVKRTSMVSQMSMVLQEPYLFSGTVSENIRYSHEDVTDEEVVAAAKSVGAHDFIMAMEGDYNTELSERGQNLSVGQRQLISFARAIVGNPRILVLDEATANIDTHTEVLIQTALKQVLHGRTSIVIAHRLSTIRNSDKIVVLHLGQVQEVGTHEELLAKGGFYARLHEINYSLGTADSTLAGGDGGVAVASPADDNNE